MARINVPPLTRALLALLFTFSSLNFAFRYRQWAPSDHTGSFHSSLYNVPYLTIVPNQSIKYPWTEATAFFVEENIFSFVASGLTLFYGGRYLERAWGSSEFAKFVAFVTAIPNLFTFFVYAVWYSVTRNANVGSTTINGAVALEAAFLVAFKQLVPEHTVSLFRSIIRIRVKHFPAIFVLANSLSGPLLGTDTAFFLSWSGFLTAWIYLRFFRAAPSLATSATGEGAVMKGDASDTFAFAHFFPEPIEKLLSPVCDSIYDVLVQAKVCTPFSTEDVEAGNEQANARAEGGLPSLMNGGGGGGGGGGKAGGRREEAERRRALALRALDQRLNAAAASRATSAPNMPDTAASEVVASQTAGQDLNERPARA